jgi:hypothetical protein
MSNKLACALLIFAASLAATSASQAAWAIAQGDDGKPIVSRQYPVEGAARAQALRDCAKYTQNCKIVLADPQGCAALANNGTKSTKWGFGESHTKPRARQAAVAQCEALAGAGQCKVVHEFCGM